MKLKPAFDAEHPGKYPDAMAAMPEMFFRVRRENDRLGFKPDTKFDYIWLQYYWFCYFNDADEPLDEGDHEGDWLCVDLTLKVPKGDPQPLKHAVLCSSFFHNHSREFFVNRSKLKLEGDHVNVYMEANCNEPWPNAAPNRDWRDDHHNEQNSSWPVNRKGEKGFWANSRSKNLQAGRLMDRKSRSSGSTGVGARHSPMGNINLSTLPTNARAIATKR